MADKKNINLAEQRRKAETKLAERRKKTDPLPSMDADIRRLVHELQVHQIELEMQNEELMQARAEREATLVQYTDLYDFAPTGYFTLARDGAIRKVNLTGAELLGVARSELLERRFGLFVADEFRSVFNDFLESVFESKKKDSLDLMLGKKGQAAQWVLIEAVCADDQEECRATVTDISARKHAEEALGDSEELLRVTLSSISDPVFITDDNGNFFYICPNVAAALGFSLEEIKSMGSIEKLVGSDLFSPEDLKEQGEIANLEHSLLDKSGTQHDFLVSVKQVSIGKGTILYTFHNITERKQAEAQTRYQANLLNTVGQSVIVTELSGKIICWNRFAENLYGWSADEVIGKNIMDVTVSYASKEQAVEIMERLNAGEIWSGDFLVQRRDGTTFPAFVTNTPIVDDQGVLIGIIGASSDVTERKEVEEELRQSEARFRAIAENTPDHILIHDSELKYTMVINPQFGLTEEDVLGKTDYDLLSKEEADTLVEAKKKVMASGNPLHFETSITTRAGEPEFFAGAYIPTFDEQSQLTGLIGYFRNVTESKQAEELLKKSEANLKKEQQVSHVGSWAWYPSSNRLEWSDEMFRIFGVEQEEFSGDLSDIMQKAIHPDDRAAVEESNLSVINDGKPIPLEYRIIRPDGAVRTVWAEAGELVLDEAGNPAVLTGIVQDISERKFAEEKIIKANLLLEETGKIAKIGGWELDLTTMEPYFSAEIFNVYELPPPIPPKLEDGINFYAPEARSVITQAVNDAINKNIPYDLELPFITAKGRDIWVRAQGRVHVEDGKPVRLYGTLQDITERKQAEAQLKLQSHALESAANAILVTDTEGTIQWVNPAFSALTGYSSEEVLGQNPRVLKSGQHDAAFYKNLWDTIGSGEIWRGEIINRHKDGVLYPEEMTIAPLVSDDGKINNFIAVKEDISERVRSQVALQQYTNQLETLYTVTAALSTSLELDKVLELILAQIGYVIPFDSGAIFLHEKDGLHVVAEFGITPSLKGIKFPAENKLFQEIWETKKPLIVNNLAGDSRFQNWGMSANLGSWMGVPLFVRDTLIGNLTLDSVQPDAYSLEQANLALSFASQAAQAIENARLFQEATQRLERMNAVRKIDKAIINNIDLNVTLNIVLDQLREKLEVDAAAVLLYEKKGQVLGFFQGRGFQSTWIQEINLLLGQGFAGKVALDRRDLFIQDLNRSEIRALRPEKIKEENFISYYGIPLIAKEQLIGVLEIFHRSLLNPDSEWVSFLQTLAGQAAIAIDNITLYSDLQSLNTQLSLAYDATIEGWADALELKDMETEGHSRRVVETTIGLARTLGYSVENLAHIRRGALLHDIGKMGVPDAILQKPGPLTESEWQVMREHPVYAYKWLSSIDYLKPALNITYCHHEKWDGTGYPRGLAGEKIPLDARIFAIVDVWDALRSDRPYRKAWSQEKTLAYIQAESAKHFDPQVVAAFIKYLNESGDNP